MKEDKSERRILIIAGATVAILLFCCLLVGLFFLFGMGPFVSGGSPFVLTPAP